VAMTIYPEIETLLGNYPDLTPVRDEVERGCDLLVDCYRGGGKVLVCGNGGSAADCEHLVGELMKGYLSTRPLPASQQAALLQAAQVARALGLGTLGFTGRRGALREVCALTIGVPHDQTAVIQERHLALYHAICGALERTLFGPKSK